MESGGLQTALGFLGPWLEYRARTGKIPGFCIAVYSRGTIVFSQAYGFANLERQEVLQTSHVFSMASQSKMVTATAIMQFVAHGDLRLDDAAYIYLPWLGQQRDKRFRHITIRQLLSHSAGLMRDGVDSNFWEFKRPFPTTAELQTIIRENSIALEPNTQLKYSNLGYALLGQIIEAVSGRRYTSYVHEHIITPLGLHRASADYPSTHTRNVAGAYGPLIMQRRQELGPRLPTEAMAAAVGFHATAEDMCQFAAAHFFGTNTLLDEQYKKEMQRDQWATIAGDGQSAEFGLGFEIQPLGERRVVGHSGHLAGHASATFFDPHQRIAVAVTANCNDAPVVNMVSGIFEALDWFHTYGHEPTPASIARFRGRLRNATTTVEIVAAASRLAVINPDDWEPFTWLEELTYTAPNVLRITTPGSLFNQGEFIRFYFAGDAVAAIRYAGLTMLPEARYVLPSSSYAGKKQAGPWSVDTDLMRAELTVGHIIDIKRCSSGKPGNYQLTVDFNPKFGTVQAYILYYGPGYGLHMYSWRVLAAVYPVWRLGQTTTNIMLLGAADNDTAITAFTASLRQVPDPNLPLTLPPSRAVRLYQRYTAETTRHYFTFEPLPLYPVEDEAWTDSLPAWIQGKYNKSLALLNQAQEIPPEWFVHYRQNTARRIRIRVADDEPTAYQSWEIESFKRLHIPLANETVYLLPRKYLAGVRAPEGDMVVFDDNRVMVNGHTPNFYVTHSTFYDTAHDQTITDFLRLRQQLLRLAQTFGTKLTL